mgnify:CR=1 FL=1
MKDLKGIALACVGLLLVAGVLLLTSLGHSEAQPHAAARFHQYLNGLYTLFAIYALLMPVIFTVMFLWAPSGLNIYWLVNNVLAIGQQSITNRLLGPARTPRPAAERRLPKKS